MSSSSNNYFIQVQTLANSGVGSLQNTNCFIRISEKKFQDFQNQPGQLSPTILLQKPYLPIAVDGYVPQFQAANQRQQALVCNQHKNVSQVFNPQQLTFFLENNTDQLEMLAKSRALALGTQIESYVADQILQYPYRFYGWTNSDGSSANFVNTYQQLNSAIAAFYQYGASPAMGYAVLDNQSATNIRNTWFTAFTPNKNDESVNSWDLGRFGNTTDTYMSNLLPIHYGGYAANNDITLTVVSVSPDGTQVTFSVPSAQTQMLAASDLIQFSSANNLFFVTRVGNMSNGLQVQNRITVDADSTGSGPYTVTATMQLPMIGSANTIGQTITRPLQAGDTATVVGPHRRGVIGTSDAIFLAMPKLPDTDPYDSHVAMDITTGASLRAWYGFLPNEGQTGFVMDVQYGSTFFDDYSMGIILPINYPNNG